MNEPNNCCRTFEAVSEAARAIYDETDDNRAVLAGIVLAAVTMASGMGQKRSLECPSKLIFEETEEIFQALERVFGQQ